MTTITLNRTALKALIDADPEFELQLKNNVISEVGRRFFEKDARRVIAAAEPELFAQALKGVQHDHEIVEKIKVALSAAIVQRDQNYWTKVKLTPAIQKLIDEAVIEVKNRAIRSALDTVTTEIGTRIQETLAHNLELLSVDERIQKRVDRLVDAEIDRRAEEKFKARMAGLRAAMAE
ncbi:hypothetical protein [Mesorhizobium sp. M7A.F.Ca.MR.362.00.0.0]|uniref:hypothetical protein n=1 Tax=Mesorhizobium sp. M7A.F.Ca.MR.362.00.0.0 TaxID=2496779 RepID=UPI000FD3B6D2|nr:hypothetical protein [Mesorhizobium sp. M7A.F.Ca.MR.362.00.0.0]RUU78220.1 hypothetical protein EOC06_20610 [Mesorhizobium sp. M7A.F.Ca.MR.362.00.0.0]RWN95410.1 MAG: hypothetical protein EOS05_11495 [Mesorhizobium sp.]